MLYKTKAPVAANDGGPNPHEENRPNYTASLANHKQNIAPAPDFETDSTQRAVAVAELIGTLNFVKHNLHDAAREALNAAAAIDERDFRAAYGCVSLFAAHARAATGAFRDLLESPNAEARR